MVWKPADLRPESNEVEPAGEKRQNREEITSLLHNKF